MNYNYIDDQVIEFSFLSKSECEECIKYAHRKEDEIQKNKKIISKKRQLDYSIYPDVTTENYNDYNFFKENPKYIPRLREKINFIFESNIEYPLFVQSWINIYRENKGINWHTHSILPNMHIKGYTANIFLGGNEDIGFTYAIHDKGKPRYRYKNIKNKIGHMIIIPNTMFHMVKKNYSQENRYTIGITISEYNQTLCRHYFNTKSNCEHLLILPEFNDLDKKKNIIKYN